jgi:hypothetical protein
MIPAGTIYSNNGKFTYLFTHDTSNDLYLTIIDNWTGSQVGSGDIKISLSKSPSLYRDLWAEMDLKTSESLVWVGNNDFDLS